MAAGPNARRGSSSDEGLDSANKSAIARDERVDSARAFSLTRLLQVFEGDFGFVWYRLRDVVPRYASIDWK